MATTDYQGNVTNSWDPNKYADGDALHFNDVLIAERVLVKGGGLTTNSLLKWTRPSGATSAITDTLGIDLSALVQAIDGDGLTYSGQELKVDARQGLFIDNTTSSSPNYHGLAIDIYTPLVGSVLTNMSGLEFSSDNANGQLKVMLDHFSGSTDNVSGLEIVGPRTISSVNFSGGLRVKFGNGLDIEGDGGYLYVKRDSYAYKNGTRQSTSGSTKNNPLKVSANGISFNYGAGLDIGTNSELKALSASTSQAGIVQLQDSIADGVTTKAPTVNAVYDAIASATPNIATTAPVTKSTSGNTVTIGLDLGNGLIVIDDSLAVKSPSGSGLTVNSNGVSLNMDNITGSGLSYSGCTLSVNIDTAKDTANIGAGSADKTYSTSYVNSLEAALTALINGQINNRYEVVASVSNLPQKGESQSWADFYNTYKGAIYLVGSGSTTTGDGYSEYVLVSSTTSGQYRWEKVGDTDIQLANYVAKNDILSETDVQNIITAAFGF